MRAYLVLFSVVSALSALAETSPRPALPTPTAPTTPVAVADLPPAPVVAPASQTPVLAADAAVPAFFDVADTKYPMVALERYTENGAQRTAYRQIYINRATGNPFFTNHRGDGVRVATPNRAAVETYIVETVMVRAIVDGREITRPQPRYHRIPPNPRQTREDVIRLAGGNNEATITLAVGTNETRESNIQLVCWDYGFGYGGGNAYFGGAFYGGTYTYFNVMPQVYVAPVFVQQPVIVQQPIVQPWFPQPVVGGCWNGGWGGGWGGGGCWGGGWGVRRGWGFVGGFRRRCWW